MPFPLPFYFFFLSHPRSSHLQETVFLQLSRISISLFLSSTCSGHSSLPSFSSLSISLSFFLSLTSKLRQSSAFASSSPLFLLSLSLLRITRLARSFFLFFTHWCSCYTDAMVSDTMHQYMLLERSLYRAARWLLSLLFSLSFFLLVSLSRLNLLHPSPSPIFLHLHLSFSSAYSVLTTHSSVSIVSYSLSIRKQDRTHSWYNSS